MSWVQSGINIASTSGAALGYSVSLTPDGSIVAIGSPSFNNSNIAGAVGVYKKDANNAWSLFGSVISNGIVGDHFGVSVSLSSNGSIIAIGARANTNGNGAAYIYEKIGNIWTLIGNVINGSNGENLGVSISLSSNGSVVAIGAPGKASNSGAAYIYERSGSSWNPKGTIFTGSSNTSLGTSISLSSDGSIVAIGAPGAETSPTPITGSVNVYEWNNSSNMWGTIGTGFNASAPDTLFGYSISLSSDGSVIAIGELGANTRSGAAYIYERSGSGWAPKGSVFNGSSDEGLGVSVALSPSGSVVAIGSVAGQTGPGRVRIYEWGTTWTQRGTDFNGSAGDLLGTTALSLSSDGSAVAFGVPYINSQAGEVRVYSFTASTQVTSICFLADAPVLTPIGYRPISTIAVGDLVRTAAGRDVIVQRVFAKEYKPSASANPYVIPKGTFGALRSLPISSNHEVMVPGKGMVKAKNLGLRQMKMTDSFTYYNLELEDWVRDNLVVAGVECESLAPAKRITMTKAEFLQFVKSRYGPSASARLRSVCFEETDGHISMPALC